MGNQPAVAVDSSAISKIQYILRLTGRIRRIVAIISAYGYHIVFSKIHIGGNIRNNRQISPEVFIHQMSVNPDFRFTHDRLEMQEQLLILPFIYRSKMLTIPYLPLIIRTPTGFRRLILYSVRQ